MNNAIIEDKLVSLLKEEQWGRIDPKNISVSKFKILDDFFDEIVKNSDEANVVNYCHQYLDEQGYSITVVYLLGILAYYKNITDDKIHLKELTDLFLKHHKWSVVEYISEQILEYGENRFALKALATSLERLGQIREAIPVWEELLKLDRFDAQVAKRISFAILDEDPGKSIQYMKIAIEGFIKNGEFDELNEIYPKLINASWDDIGFYDRIERMIVDAKHTNIAAEMLKCLYEKYKDVDVDQSIILLKRVLTYIPLDNNSRKAIIELYTAKYGNHSQFEQFLKLSKIKDFNIPVNKAIESFEKNIVFDRGNFVHHRSWGLGEITDIDSENIVIDFKEKKEHRMSVQMALQSLVPINKDHLYALKHKDADKINNLFSENIVEFLKLLVKSYGGEIIIASIKKELIPEYVEQKNWSKFWSKTRIMIKKDPLFGISTKEKDKIFLREKPITLADELLNRFIKCKNFSEKLNIAVEFVNSVDVEEGENVVGFFIDFFIAATKENSNTKLLLSYFILQNFAKYVNDKKLKLVNIKENVVRFIKESNDLAIISVKITSYDYKKDFIDLIEEIRDDWIEVVSEFLFEIPVRIHKYIISKLIRKRAYQEINYFIDKVISGARQFPEIFLWISRCIYTGIWGYQWLDYSQLALTLGYFRILNELKKLEGNRNKLKNNAVELLFSNDAIILKDIINENNPEFLNKIYDIAVSADFIEESYLEKFMSLIIEKYPDFKPVKVGAANENMAYDDEVLWVTQAGFDKKINELNKMVKIDMIQLSKDLSKTADLTGDLRENVDYNALLEKQTILKLSISKLDDDLKRAKIIKLVDIDLDIVNIGTTVEMESVDSKIKEVKKYTILGPWDANYDNNILSYRSPIAKAILRKKVSDIVDIKMGDFISKYKINSIEAYIKE